MHSKQLNDEFPQKNIAFNEVSLKYYQKDIQEKLKGKRYLFIT